MQLESGASNTRVRRWRGNRSVTLVCRGTLPQPQLDAMASRLGDIVRRRSPDEPRSSIEVGVTDEPAPAGAPSIVDLLVHISAANGLRDAARTSGPASSPALDWVAPHGVDPVAVWGMDPDGA